MGEVRTLAPAGNDTPEQFVTNMSQHIKKLREDGAKNINVVCVISYEESIDGELLTNYRGGWTSGMPRERVYYAGGWMQQRAMKEYSDDA
jgi:hypothetical protein